MEAPLKIVGIGGSLAVPSRSLAALQIALEAAEMEFVVRSLRGWAVPLVMPISHVAQVFDGTGRAMDPGVDAQLRALGREVVRAARQFAELGYCDYSD